MTTNYYVHNHLFNKDFPYLVIDIWYTIIQFLNINKPFSLNLNFKNQEILKKLLNYIEDNFSENITLNLLSDELFISKSTIQRLFTNHLNTSPYDYIINFRINKSLPLLLNTDYSISEIAFLVGFNNTSQYIKHFKNILNITPNKYKHSH